MAVPFYNLLVRKPSLPIVFGLALGIAALGFFAYDQMALPKPQSSFTDGQAAPDFTLKDQSGSPFHLSALRGQKVLLIFYRGYW